MDLFDHVHDKSRNLQRVVSYQRTVPLERGLCYCFYLVAKHGFHPTILSASRDDFHISTHNREYGTHLHGQLWLIAAHARDPVHFAPANPVDQTSHCLRSDGNKAYGIALRGHLPWYMRGIDLANNVQAERFCVQAASLGLRFVRPYHSGLELHHVVCVADPTETLVHHSVIHSRRLPEAMDEAAQTRAQTAQELRP